jgi:microcystin-dependent protein
MEGTLGEIRIFAGSFPPQGWAFCNGQSMPINQYQALYTILGTTYGGDGQTTFQLPKLSAPVNVGGTYGQYIICIQGMYPTSGR